MCDTSRIPPSGVQLLVDGASSLDSTQDRVIVGTSYAWLSHCQNSMVELHILTHDLTERHAHAEGRRRERGKSNGTVGSSIPCATRRRSAELVTE